jgi:hypothetical protein
VWVSISEFIILIAIRTLEHSIYRYFLSRNIIRKEVRATTTNVLKPSASLSSYEGSKYAALFIISFSVDVSCSFLGFGNDSAFNYNHMLLSLFSSGRHTHRLPILIQPSLLNSHIINTTVATVIIMQIRKVV